MREIHSIIRIDRKHISERERERETETETETERERKRELELENFISQGL